MPFLGFLGGCIVAIIMFMLVGSMLSIGDVTRVIMIATVFLSGLITGCSTWIVFTFKSSQK